MKSAVLALAAMLLVTGVVTDDNQQKLADAVNEFSQRLHQKIALDKPNIAYSPVAIHASLSMLSMGAKQETLRELEQLLNLTLQSGNPHETYRDLSRDLKSLAEITYGLPKGLLVQARSQIEKSFKDEAQDKYSAKVSQINPAAPGGPEKEMNDYVADKTQDLVQEIIAKGSIDKDASLLLVSAFVLNATFEDQFDQCNTDKQDFFQADGKVSQVDMMNDTQEILFKRDDSSEVTVIRLPFRGKRLALIVALPHRRDGLANLEKRLASGSDIDNLLQGLERKKVRVALPRFKVDSSIQLRDALMSLGLNKAVTQGAADFSGISKKGGLSLTKDIHRTIINIKEAGSETTRDSQGDGDQSHAPPSDDASETFRADRSFMFFIWDSKIEGVLVAGKFSN